VQSQLFLDSYHIFEGKKSFVKKLTLKSEGEGFVIKENFPESGKRSGQ